MRTRLAVWATVAVVVATGSANAQLAVVRTSQADSALEAGDLALADSLYYLAVRYRPRDPVAREALGRYLGMRGATRIAVVLLEEARLFGGDPVRIGAELAPMYGSIGDWRALLTLQSSPLTAPERKRAAWFSDHPGSTRTGTGSQLLVGAPVADTLGRVAIHVGSQAAMAVILARDSGLTIGSHLSGGTSMLFDAKDSSVMALDSIAVGAARLFNVPAWMGDSPQAAIVDFGLLGPLVPTLDYGKGRITFGRPIVTADWIRFPLLRTGSELRVLDHGRWVGLAEFAARIAKAKQAMTIDYHAGEVLVRP